MLVEQLYTNCLAQATYYVESEGEAAIIDPLRDTDDYIQKAQERGVKIKYIFETHFHADFVSGHIDLAKKTGAEIIYGPGAVTSYKIHEAKDGEVLKLGKLGITVLHTPGHTPESSCYLLKDESGEDYCLFSGDTLFVGDVGRPDLLDGKMTKEELASMMYDSLNTKIKPLADDIILYPGHGPGSSCGKNLGPETYSTIGAQKASNYAMQDMSREEFISQVTDGITAPPNYFFDDARLNKTGYPSLEAVIEAGNTALDLSAFQALRNEGVRVVDVRIPDEFELGFIPNAINIGLNGQYAIWAGTLLPIHEPLVLVCPEGKEEEAVMRLARVGFDKIQGFLKGGFNTWQDAGKRIDMVISVTPEEFALDFKHSPIEVLDVRKPSEWDTCHLEGATLGSLQDLEEKIPTLDKSAQIYVHCAGGYRSMIASSMLKAAGFSLVKNVYGGWSKIKELDLPKVMPAKQSV